MTSFPLVADISSYQPDEPAFFQALKNQGVKAVIIKITQGSAGGDAYINPKAKTQIGNARVAGLLVHGYHYARFVSMVGKTRSMRPSGSIKTRSH